jgi:hypothetical protein
MILDGLGSFFLSNRTGGVGQLRSTVKVSSGSAIQRVREYVLYGAATWSSAPRQLAQPFLWQGTDILLPVCKS